VLKSLFGHAAFVPLRRKLGEWLEATQWQAWARLHTGQRLRVDLSSSIGRSILLRGTYEPLVEAALRDVLRPGDVFVDVGANVGYFSVVAAPLVGAKGAVHGFEPNPRVAGLLRRSIARNGLSNVFVDERAVWSTTTRQGLRLERNSAVSFLEPEGAASARDVEVGAVRLDDYLSAFPARVALVKMDVEGAELHGLKGMEARLRSDRPTLILEAQDWCLQRYGQDLPDLLGYLTALGYSAFDLYGKPIAEAEEARRRLAGEWVKNLVFRPR
jgi:FkbM family methyltransferase